MVYLRSFRSRSQGIASDISPRPPMLRRQSLYRSTSSRSRSMMQTVYPDEDDIYDCCRKSFALSVVPEGDENQRSTTIVIIEPRKETRDQTISKKRVGLLQSFLIALRHRISKNRTALPEFDMLCL